MQKVAHTDVLAETLLAMCLSLRNLSLYVPIVGDFNLSWVQRVEWCKLTVLRICKFNEHCSIIFLFKFDEIKMSSIKQFLIFKNNMWIMVINFIDSAIITDCIQLVCSSVATSKLFFKKIEMLLLDWEDSLENVPVNIRFTWGSSYRSFVYPSVIHVYEHH